MPDISNEIAAIQVATTGAEIRSAIVEALSVINASVPTYYSGSYIVTPGSESITLSTSNKGMYDDVTIEAFPVYSGAYIITPSTISQTFSVSSMMMLSDILVNPMTSYLGPYQVNSMVQYDNSITLSVGSKYVLTNIEVSLFHRPCFNVTHAIIDTFDLGSSWESYASDISDIYKQSFYLNSTSYSATLSLVVVPTSEQLSYFRDAGIETFFVQMNSYYSSIGVYDFVIMGSSLSTSLLSSNLTFQCLLSYASALNSMIS